MSWLRSQERMRSLLENSKKNTGWSKRETDNIFREPYEHFEKLDSEFIMPKAPLKQRRQQNASKS